MGIAAETENQTIALARLTWLALASLAVVDASWIALGGFHLVLGGIAAPALFVALLAGAAVLLRRLRRHPSSIALLDAVAQILACFALGAVLSYLALSLDRPLIDDRLAALDGWLGFDWPRYVAWVQARPYLDVALFTVYFSPLLQIILITAVLGIVDRRRLQELSTLLLIALMLTIAVSALFPGLDAYNHYAASHPELRNELGVYDLVPLRQGALRTLDLRRFGGLISFPSYHTVLALLFIHAVRGIRGLFPVSLVLNALVVLATLTAGGHFLVDLLGGGVVTAASIGLCRWLSRRGGVAGVTRRPAFTPTPTPALASSLVEAAGSP